MKKSSARTVRTEEEAGPLSLEIECRRWMGGRENVPISPETRMRLFLSASDATKKKSQKKLLAPERKGLKKPLPVQPRGRGGPNVRHNSADGKGTCFEAFFRYLKKGETRGKD